jgi:hypothetical protein
MTCLFSLSQAGLRESKLLGIGELEHHRRCKRHEHLRQLLSTAQRRASLATVRDSVPPPPNEQGLRKLLIIAIA